MAVGGFDHSAKARDLAPPGEIPEKPRLQLVKIRFSACGLATPTADNPPRGDASTKQTARNL